MNPGMFLRHIISIKASRLQSGNQRSLPRSTNSYNRNLQDNHSYPVYIDKVMVYRYLLNMDK